MNDPRQASPGQPLTGHPAPPSLQPNAPRPVITPNPTMRPAVVPRPAGVGAPAGAPAHPPGIQSPRPAPPIQPQAVPARHAEHDSPIALVEDEVEVEEEAAPASKIHFGPDLGHKKHDWKRKTITPGTGAIRVKTFHGKLSDQGIEYLDDSINEWLDAHPEAEIKFVTSNVGMYEGKFKDLALILNVWY